jgi:uncharacterized DUF497 family protein
MQKKRLPMLHIQIEDTAIRIISARRATAQERRDYDHS